MRAARCAARSVRLQRRGAGACAAARGARVCVAFFLARLPAPCAWILLTCGLPFAFRCYPNVITTLTEQMAGVYTRPT